MYFDIFILEPQLRVLESAVILNNIINIIIN